MLNQNNVYATLAVKDLSAAQQFYAQKLGFEVLEETPGGLMYKSGDGRLFIYESSFAGTNQATAATWDVQGIEEVVSGLKAKGVEFEQYDFPDTRVENHIHFTEGMKAAWFKDPDGNILALVEA